MLHNHYRTPGGEDIVARAETELLSSHGIEVLSIETEQPEWNGGLRDFVSVARSTTWSGDSYHYIRRLCADFRPDIAHVHNFWMRLSPSVHKACHAAGVATVQTLHNFRLLCANAVLMREGRICEDCVGKLPWRGLVHRCYHGSLLASGAVAGMIVANRRRGTWQEDVDAFIALSDHSRDTFVRGDLPGDRIFVKPNFVPEPGIVRKAPSGSRTVVYAGRLSSEKGVHVLLKAWSAGDLGRHGTLLIAGDGPDLATLQTLMTELRLAPPGVVFLGNRSHSEVMELIADARVVVQPSLCYESFGVAVAEAFACGRAVVVSDLAALNEIVHDPRLGITFKAGDAVGLADALRTVLVDDQVADELGRNARNEYLVKYTPDVNIQILTRIYEFAAERRRRLQPTSSTPPAARLTRKTGAGVPAIAENSIFDFGK